MSATDTYIEPRWRRWIKRNVLRRHRYPNPARRFSGFHDDRLDGLSDILPHVRGASVLDIGTNRGMMPYGLAMAGANVIHGCDHYAPGIEIAREVFTEFQCESRFEVVDLRGGPSAMEAAFGSAYRARYDIVSMLAVFQKFADEIGAKAAHDLVVHLANRTGRFFIYRVPPQYADRLDAGLRDGGLVPVHLSLMHPTGAASAIWAREPKTKGAVKPVWSA